MQQVGQRIKRFREMRDIPMKDFAEKLGMTVQGYSRIERDEVSVTLDKLEQISKILEMSVSEMLTDDRFVFNLQKNTVENCGYISQNKNFPPELKQLYEDKIKLLEELLKAREGEIERLKIG